MCFGPISNLCVLRSNILTYWTRQPAGYYLDYVVRTYSYVSYIYLYGAAAEQQEPPCNSRTYEYLGRSSYVARNSYMYVFECTAAGRRGSQHTGL